MFFFFHYLSRPYSLDSVSEVVKLFLFLASEEIMVGFFSLGRCFFITRTPDDAVASSLCYADKETLWV